jgi:hypothetical protein
MEPLGYQLEAEPESVFSPPPGPRAELLVGATVKKVQANLCFPFSGSPSLNVGDPSLTKGTVFVEIVWELYSVSQAKVVHTATTSGTFESKDAIGGGIATMVLNAFMNSLSNLAADAAFHKQATTRPPLPQIPVIPATRS